MRLYFMRHGIAEDMHPSGDFARALTDEGRAQLATSAAMLKGLEIRPAHLYSSPLVRARQTAEILAPVLGLEVEIRESLGPGFSVTSVASLVRDSGHGDMMFVGHEPDFSETIGRLIGTGRVVMKKGGLARVDLVSLQPLRGELVWLIAPRVFGALSDR